MNKDKLSIGAKLSKKKQKMKKKKQTHNDRNRQKSVRQNNRKKVGKLTQHPFVNMKGRLLM